MQKIHKQYREFYFTNHRGTVYIYFPNSKIFYFDTTKKNLYKKKTKKPPVVPLLMNRTLAGCFSLCKLSCLPAPFFVEMRFLYGCLSPREASSDDVFFPLGIYLTYLTNPRQGFLKKKNVRRIAVVGGLFANCFPCCPFYGTFNNILISKVHNKG